MATVIEVKYLTKRYRDLTAVDGVSLKIEQHGIYGLLGRNGAGKTTLMQLLAGHEFPTGGQVQVLGESPVENSSVLANVAIIKESQKYPENYKLHHVLKFASQTFKNWDNDFALELVAQFRLTLGKQVRKFSRGQLSAVGVIVGLASRAPITIYDEPYLGMDAVARKQFYDLLLADYIEHPRTIVLSTHLIDEVADLLEHVFVIDEGKIILNSNADELRGSAVILEGPAEQLAAMTDGHEILESESIGNQQRIVVLGLSDEELSTAKPQGVSVHAASLQQLIIGKTSGLTKQEMDIKL